ncbi:MAG: R3H domain-containing nucleic acid-binding protein [Anaerolineae bacterium]
MKEITDDLDVLLDVLPPALTGAVQEKNNRLDLLEVVMDLGRPPEARFLDEDVILSKKEITAAEIEYVVERIGAFGGDNRAGIPRTLHRISAIRNRTGQIVGLTCRVGRAVYGTVDIVRDIVESGKSILLLGRPGVGKTTLLREVARILGEKKRVIIVDTSNEIGGDGDIPHPAIGRARRMQVPTPLLQHEVMIEAVENHMPDVIVIDEIGRELEAEAARTIAERGVQLVGTAHGNTLDNLMMNPTLADLVGGIQSVTLSDEEARRRGTQKSVLERKQPPTFDVVIEIQDWDRLAVHHDVAAAVDAILRGRSRPAELRYRDETGKVQTEEAVLKPTVEEPAGFRGRQPSRPLLQTVRIFPYGASQNRLRQAAKALALPIVIVEELGDANALLTLKSYYRKRPQAITEAERMGVPIYVLRSNTVTQMEGALLDIFGLEATQDPFEEAMREAQMAIEQIKNGGRDMVELRPQDSYIRRQQHELAREADLISHSRGKEPRRRVRIYRNDSR